MYHSILKLVTGLLLISNVAAQEPDWTSYAEVLAFVQQGEKHGTQLALVGYAALKQNGLVEKAYRQISSFPVESLASREEKLAFYINTYNILALKMLVDNWPVNSIKDLGGFFSPVWDKRAGVIAGRAVSLDDIENIEIRPMGDPRIHFAIVCASVSCPDLRKEPYTAEKLNQQLDNQAKIFLHNEQKGLRVENNEIIVSKIFSWFEMDFKQAGGIDVFIRRYRPDLPVTLSIDADIDYDWAVNGLALH